MFSSTLLELFRLPFSISLELFLSVGARFSSTSGFSRRPIMHLELLVAEVDEQVYKGMYLTSYVVGQSHTNRNTHTYTDRPCAVEPGH